MKDFWLHSYIHLMSFRHYYAMYDVEDELYKLNSLIQLCVQGPKYFDIYNWKIKDSHTCTKRCKK